MSKKVGAIVLAAGKSRRMGTAKALLELQGKPLFRHAVDRAFANQLEPILLIAGEHGEAFRQVTSPTFPVEILHNPDYETGMASSLRVGIMAVRGRVDAALVFLADQPLVPDEVVRSLIETYQVGFDKGVRIVRPVYAGMAGHPVLFDASLFDELEEVTGDQGGKEVIGRHKQQLATVAFENEQWGKDIDTPEEYQDVLDSL